MRTVCALLIFVIQINTVFANMFLMQKQSVQRFINQMVRENNFNRSQLIDLLRSSQFQAQVIASMQKPYENKTWDIYKQLFLTPQRLQSGLVFWRKNKQTLAEAQQKYGVPASIIVAILGVETLYGQHQGNYRVLDALTTLAFYYPKRSQFFTQELQQYLLLCREHGVVATQYLGSYAGAMGKPQFMPSSYRTYAVDFSGHGRPNLMTEDPDVINSVANFLNKHGWQSAGAITELATIHGELEKRIITNLKYPSYSLGQLLAAGIKLATPPTNYLDKVGLIALTTQQGLEFWLAYHNFYVITHYNTSPQYALVVYLLSEQLRHEYEKTQD